MSLINIFSSVWILTVLTLVWDPSHSAVLSSCHVSPKSNGLHLDCSNRNLKELPRHLENTDLVSVDFSRNNFKTLDRFVFRGISSIRELNISSCGIEKISSLAFQDLTLLEVLDMKNNPILGGGLPRGLFVPLPKLQRLFVSGRTHATSDIIPWKELSNLTEIIFTPGSDDSLWNLAALPNLRKVYFIHCRFGSVLTPATTQAFRNSTIQELAFITCGIKTIANGTFDGLSSLEVLNLAGNSQLNIDNVIDVLSASSNVIVKTLILDLVGSSSGPFVAGRHERPGCRAAWLNLRKVSIRGIDIISINSGFQNCFSNLEAIALGFNTITKCGNSWPECVGIFIGAFLHVRYIDMAYFMVSNTPGLEVLSGFNNHANWVKLNEDYFPSFKEYTLETCNPHTGPSNFDVSWNKTCIWQALPPCLTYFKADHSFKSLFAPTQHRQCVQCSSNTLKYLNISSRFTASTDITGLNRTVLGLSELRTLDASKFGLKFLDFEVLQRLPSLEIFHLEGNLLGLSLLSHIPRHIRLQDLNMAMNYIKEFPADMFINLVALQHLDISNNQLNSVRFKLPPSLKHLDLSSNLLTSFDSSTRLMMNAMSLLVLHLDHNPFQCDCSETSFIKWYQKTVTNITNRGNIICQQSMRTRPIMMIKTSQLEIKCGLTVNVVVISSVVSSVVVLMATLPVIVYRYRWIIRWRFYKLRHLRHHRNEDMLLIEFNGELKYSSYVIYPYDDNRTMLWITETLIPGVERNLQKPEMFIKGRDDLGGEAIIDEIVRGIMRSQTAIWIICPEFFRDKYCEMSAKFALDELGARNNLLVILENRFENYSIPGHFANMMHPNVGLTRVRYTNSEEGRSLFWAKLNGFLPAWSYI